MVEQVCALKTHGDVKLCFASAPWTAFHRNVWRRPTAWPRYSPWEDTSVTCCVLYRGDVMSTDMNKVIATIKVNKRSHSSLTLVPVWVKNGHRRPGDLARVQQALCALANTTTVGPRSTNTRPRGRVHSRWTRWKTCWNYRLHSSPTFFRRIEHRVQDTIILRSQFPICTPAWSIWTEIHSRCWNTNTTVPISIKKSIQRFLGRNRIFTYHDFYVGTSNLS